MSFVHSHKRAFLYLMAAVLTVAMVGAACSSGDDEEESTAGSGQPQRGGTLRVAIVSDQFNFDVPLLTSVPDIVVVDSTYDTLIMRQPDWSLQPMLATSWESNDDVTQWTFHLRKGVKFSHGKEFKAEDVIYTFDRLFEVESPLASVLDIVTDIVEVDDYTVRFDLSSPNAYLPQLVVRYQANITPSDIDPEQLATGTYGTGPFIMTENVVGERTVLTKNPDYWWEGFPYLDEVILVYLPEPESRAEALKTGSVDVIYDLTRTSAPTLEDHPETRVSLATSSSYLNLAMDVTVEPFDNILLRKALQAATDREAILQASLFGRGGIAYDHPIPPSDPVFNEACKPQGYDPVLAESLLEQAGYPNGIDLTLYTSTTGGGMVELATVMKDRAEPAGIRIDIQVEPEDVYWSDVWMVKPFSTVFWGARLPDAALSIVYKSDAAWNESKYNNPRVDELIIQARGQPNLEDRKVTYAEIQCILVDEVPRIVPVFKSIMRGLRLDVRNMEANPEDKIFFRDAWLDR